LREHLSERQKVGVAAQISAAADGDFIGDAAHALSRHLENDCVHGLEAGIALHNGAGAVVAALLEGHAKLAAEGWDAFYSFEITVAAKALAIQARSSSDIGKYLHVQTSFAGG